MKWQHRSLLAALGLAALVATGSALGIAEGKGVSTGSTGTPRASGDIHAAVVPIVALDRAKVLARTADELFVLVRFEIAEPVRVRPERPPLNVALVIDRSGSMADRGKITHAREAAIRLIDSMASTDVLGVVEYDDQITTLWPSSPLTSPSRVKRLVSELTPRGSTNLAGGLLRGIEEGRRYSSDFGIHRIILLSDGLANVGITSPMEIAGFVHRARNQGIGVSTIGLGLEYNEDLMQTIAEAGGGNYYYVESPSQMAAIFERELSTLCTTVAKNVRIHFEAGEGIRDLRALGYDVIPRDGGFEIPLEDLYGGEKRTVLLRLHLDPVRPGPVDLGALRLDYADPESNESFAVRYELAAEATEDPAAVRASTDNLVSAEATLIAAEETHEQCVRDYERGEKELAKQNLSQLSTLLSQANQSFQDVRIEKKLEQLQLEVEDMDRADLNEENRQMYLKGSKASLYRAQKGKRGSYLLQERDAGFEVERLQTRLQELQLFHGAVDGIYSEEVAGAVREYQQQNGLQVDGIAGPATLRSLNLY